MTKFACVATLLSAYAAAAQLEAEQYYPQQSYDQYDQYGVGQYDQYGGGQYDQYGGVQYDQYGSGQYDSYGQYDQLGQYSQAGQYDQLGQYAQAGQYDQYSQGYAQQPLQQQQSYSQSNSLGYDSVLGQDSQVYDQGYSQGFDQSYDSPLSNLGNQQQYDQGLSVPEFGGVPQGGLGQAGFGADNGFANDFGIGQGYQQQQYAQPAAQQVQQVASTQASAQPRGRAAWYTKHSHKKSPIGPTMGAISRVQEFGKDSFVAPNLAQSRIHTAGSRGKYSQSGLIDRSSMSLGPNKLTGLLGRISAKANKFGDFKPKMNLGWTSHTGTASGRGRNIGKGRDYW